MSSWFDGNVVLWCLAIYGFITFIERAFSEVVKTIRRIIVDRYEFKEHIAKQESAKTKPEVKGFKQQD